MSSDTNVQRSRSLLSILLRKTPSGAPRFDPDAVRHTLPFLLLPVLEDVPADAIPASVQELFGELALLIGHTPGKPTKDLQQRIQVHYERFPPDLDLMQEIAEFIRSELGGAVEQEVLRAMDKTLGTQRRLQALQQDGRPQGTVAAGPMARAALMHKGKSEPER